MALEINLNASPSLGLRKGAALIIRSMTGAFDQIEQLFGISALDAGVICAWSVPRNGLTVCFSG